MVVGWVTPKLSGSENDILVLHPGVSETCEIHYVTDADRRSFSDDCDLGVYTSRYTHPPPILAGKSIPVDARPIGPVLSTPVAVTRGEGVGLGYAPDAPLLVHGTLGMIVAFGAALTAVLML